MKYITQERRIRCALESYFEFERLDTNWRTEILAGVTTFVTMAYVLVLFWHTPIY